MKKLRIVALCLTIIVLCCCLSACIEHKGKVPDSLLARYGFGGLKLIDNEDTKYSVYRTYITVKTNIESYDEYKEFCEYVYSYVTSVDGVVVAGSVDSDWTKHTIVEEFRVHSGEGLDQGYSCYDEYAYTTKQVGEDGELNEVFNICIVYNIDTKENHGYNLVITIYNSKSFGLWYYKAV